MTVSVNQQVVFITGSASGLGRHLTGRFAEQGYKVVATDINYSALQACQQEDAWDSAQVWIRKLDITRQSQWRSVWQAVLEKWQRVDVMCNVAGYLLPGYLAETAFDQIDRHIDINVKGLMYGSKHAAETMVGQGSGHIVNIASLAGIAPIPGIGLYSASKFAVRGFSLSLAQELKPLGVAVSVICPDAIETPMLTLQEDYEEAALTFSGGRTLRVEEVADVLFSKALAKKELEITIPHVRGWLSKLGNTVPAMTFVMADYLGRLGRQKQQYRKLAKP